MTVVNAESLSDATRELLGGDNDAYAKLVVRQEPRDDTLRARLAALTPQSLFKRPVASADAATALLAGLWLWHDFLDESHRISQNIHSATGSFWHAIVHRREGDFSNSMYWYARCRNHPALADVAARLGKASWDPDDFVDLVARVHNRPADPEHAEAVRIQRTEWQALFGHCLGCAG